MRALQAVMRTITNINDWLGKWISYLILAMFVLLTMEVFFRYGLSSPTAWTNELTQMLFGVYGVLSGGYLLAHNAHANVDIVHSRLSLKARASLDIVTSVLLFLFVGALLYFGSSMAFESLLRLEHSQSAWNPPVYPIKLAIPLAALLLLLQGLVKLLQDLFILFDIVPPDNIQFAEDIHEPEQPL